MDSVFRAGSSQRNKRLKGQSIMFEQVLLFTMGVTVFIIYFAVFNIYQGHFISVNVNDQLSQIKSLISSDILEMAYKEGTTSSITRKLPKRIGNEIYKIELSSKGINVTGLVSGISKHSTLYNLNKSMSLLGSVTSIGGKVIIYKKGNEIRLI
jgi:hypothetical protein